MTIRNPKSTIRNRTISKIFNRMILKKILICIALLHNALFLLGQAEFKNVVVTSSEGRVTIDYDLQPTVERAVLKAVRLTVVFKGKTIVPETVGGAIGTDVSFGFGRRLIWDCAADGRLLSGKADILLEADCEVLPPPPPPVQSFEPETVLVEGGSFKMEDRQVTVSNFRMGKYEVTQAQYRAVMGTNPSAFKDCDNCPVENVSWDDAQAYLVKLNSMTGKTYRLPTEAEWEFAARGGKHSQNYTYSGSNSLDAVAWHGNNSDSKTHPVGGKQANELGLYDLTGNVWEWCQDWYGSGYSGATVNPQGAATGSYRVFRGGSWNNYASNCRVSDRFYNTPTYRYNSLGFRVVWSLQ
jgi:formylglycine-generating enzyme required for sulfatase activity